MDVLNHCEKCDGWMNRISGMEFVCEDCGRLIDLGTGTSEGVPTVVEPIEKYEH